MRVKLTAKHPRPTSSTRSPVRTGSSTARKTTRPETPHERPSTPRGAGGDSRAGFDKRGAGDRSERRPGSSGGDERRAFKPRGDDSRPSFDKRGAGDRSERRPFARDDRTPGGDERRPFKPRDDSRPSFDKRGAGDRSERRPFARDDRTPGSDERRPFKPRDDSRPSFDKRGPSDRSERRPFARDDRTPRSDERRTFKARGDDSRPSFDKRGAGDRRLASRDDRPPHAEVIPASTEPAHKPRAHDDGLVRLSKVMSELGLCSRREADEWIEKGWVLVDGEVTDTLGTRIRPDQEIDVLPAARSAQSLLVTILLHKPVGYVSGQAEDGYEPAVTLINPTNHWQDDRSGIRFAPGHLRTLAPAGRLDIDSTGLLVLTQDGRIAKQLIGNHSEVDKEYLVRVRYGEHEVDVDQHFPEEQLALLRHGLSLDDVPLKTAQVSWQNGEQLRFVLHEGKKRQIRRMCELVGLEVVGLKRIRMGRVTLGALPPGHWRYLGADESF
ncbi:pseudouridine synthase [Caballeronia sp. TF1N1]|uniref:pseudouridine synthase n=1 Tax=Caballeronia sp. TF1N1 TaxID=2878153 RepID=UPI001FD2F1E2|nr:pseudouridine synthase [Caballeronia sp. TF1N1]